MAGKPQPILLAMIICDSMIEDKKTGKKSLIGIFNSINSATVPCTHPALNVFIVLTEGIGDYQVSLRCIKSDDEKPLIDLKGQIKFQNPHQIIECNYEIGGMKMTEFGFYRFDFYCNETLLISRKFRLLERQKNKA